MTLAQAVDRLDEFPSGDTIYAAQPWAEDSPTVVAAEPQAGGLPAAATERGLAYFLEVNIASDFLTDWKRGPEGDPNSPALCRRLIDYAVNDA